MNIKFRFSAMVMFYTIVLQIGMIHCCVYVTLTIFFILEGPFRIWFTAFFLPRIRRKGIYCTLSVSAILFLITTIMYDNNSDGRFNTAKLITGVAAKFVLTLYYAFGYTNMSENNPTGIRQRTAAIQVYVHLTVYIAILIHDESS